MVTTSRATYRVVTANTTSHFEYQLPGLDLSQFSFILFVLLQTDSDQIIIIWFTYFIVDMIYAEHTITDHSQQTYKLKNHMMELSWQQKFNPSQILNVEIPVKSQWSWDGHLGRRLRRRPGTVSSSLTQLIIFVSNIKLPC